MLMASSMHLPLPSMVSLFRRPLSKTSRLFPRCLYASFLAVGLAALLPLGQAWSQSLQSLPKEVQQAWRATKLPDTSLSLVVHELGGGRLAAINAHVPRNPASVMKMVTTWAALSGLGPEYSWRTAFYARSDARVDADGTLGGPLYL